MKLELSKNVISIVPDSPEYLDTMGWIYYKMGKYQVALDYLLKVAKRKCVVFLISDFLDDNF